MPIRSIHCPDVSRERGDRTVRSLAIFHATPRPAHKRLALLLILPALILAACGGGSDDNADTSASTGIPEPTTSTATDDREPRTESSTSDAATDQNESATESEAEPQQEPASQPIAEDARIAQDGDTVEVIYHGTLESGEVFDSSRDRGDTISFVLGSGQLIDGFDNAVRGLAIGETVVARLSPEEAYGPRDPSLEIDVPNDANAPGDLAVGDVVTLANGQRATILEITDDNIRLDLNPPLAGQTLTFEITVVSIQ